LAKPVLDFGFVQFLARGFDGASTRLLWSHGSPAEAGKQESKQGQGMPDSQEIWF
jgi:hypothetical protein